MLNSLRDVIMNYRNAPLSRDEVYIVAEKNEKVVFNACYKISASIETNYSRLLIEWSKNGVLPMEYRDYYDSSENEYPVNIEYFEEENFVHLSGEYLGAFYKIIVQLPEKRF